MNTCGEIKLAMLFVLTMAIGASAQTPKERVLRMVHQEALFPSDWVFQVVPEANWQSMLRQLHLDSTETAFTCLACRVTYIRQFYAANTTDKRLRHTLLHEYGHVACGCADERVADKIHGSESVTIKE